MADIARLRIELDEVEPRVFRRVEVPVDIRLDRLHLVIQAAMGWENYHLWEFRRGDAAWGIPDPSWSDPEQAGARGQGGLARRPPWCPGAEIHLRLRLRRRLAPHGPGRGHRRAGARGTLSALPRRPGCLPARGCGRFLWLHGLPRRHRPTPPTSATKSCSNGAVGRSTRRTSASPRSANGWTSSRPSLPGRGPRGERSRITTLEFACGYLNPLIHPTTIQVDGKRMVDDGRQRAGAAAQGRRQREDHDQSRLRRPRPHRPAGARRASTPTAPTSSAPPSATSSSGTPRRRSGSVAAQEPGPRPAPLQPRGPRGGPRRRAEMLDIRVLGLASIAADVTPELARAAIASVVVLGALHASPAVKAALADRIR